MGGAIHVPGNIHSDWPEIDNNTAEWNIWVDPLAAQEVFSAGLSLHLVPLDATNQMVWTLKEGQVWASSGSEEGNMAEKLLQGMLDAWSVKGIYVYDLAAAVIASDPVLCPGVPLALDVLVSSGPDQGQIILADHSPNVAVCFKPDSQEIKALAASVLGR